VPVLTNARYEMFAQELAEGGEQENSENLRGDIGLINNGGNAMDTTTTYCSFAPSGREQARAAEAAARKHSVARDAKSEASHSTIPASRRARAPIAESKGAFRPSFAAIGRFGTPLRHRLSFASIGATVVSIEGPRIAALVQFLL
jgi:hypothetical protein